MKKKSLSRKIVQVKKEDAGYFNLQFKRIVGMTPLEYRHTKNSAGRKTG